jgi:hypothetical protein
MDWATFWSRHSETVWASLVAIIITLVITWAFYRKAEKPKQLSWQVITANRLIRATGKDRERLKVVYKNEEDREREVNNPNILVLWIGNTGRKPITKSDFENDISIQFNQSELLSAEVGSVRDDAIAPNIEIDRDHPNVVWLKPLLLKPREWLELQFLTDGSLQYPTIKARFAGKASALDLPGRHSELKLRLFFGGMVLVTVASMTIAMILNRSHIDYVRLASVLSIIAMLAMLGAAWAIGRRGLLEQRWWKDPDQRPTVFNSGLDLLLGTGRSEVSPSGTTSEDNQTTEVVDRDLGLHDKTLETTEAK